MAEEACRLDLWLWRARLFKTRALAAKVVDRGAVRLTRAGVTERVTRRARTVRPGDELLIAISGHLRLVRVEALGERRGPAQEARGLYSSLENS